MRDGEESLGKVRKKIGIKEKIEKREQKERTRTRKG
jgi:hypothetical protein